MAIWDYIMNAGASGTGGGGGFGGGRGGGEGGEARGKLQHACWSIGHRLGDMEGLGGKQGQPGGGGGQGGQGGNNIMLAGA